MKILDASALLKDPHIIQLAQANGVDLAAYIGNRTSIK